ncbi:MetQ/NlpA family ABC transporter substrate-binding protein [Lysinibacillus xylanilyticus]|uniref:MetQ/NlpA family ABC transporter substrate-binding protein n=1 Tax=Lysinibacillus xylanilyticus TaxID=582475 RepID=UPI002B23FFBC|nr:MetQ/NlpA family ABC transporter substrate-binding protein [Lysinibacillus xylanilyticus]MEB2279890.1 MetQ/NlpA family ABC transporter substrate-binding protein [Lysinibacillus xylanilyticus]
MKKKNKILLGLASLTLVAALVGCGSKENSKDSQSKTINENKIVVGVTSGPHEQIAEVVAKVAKENGLEVELKSFSDYVLPNTSLAEGDLDVNSYQHKPFLDTFNKDHNTDLVPVGKTILNPLGIYSEKYKSFDDVPDGATFGLPNDPTNGARALFVLQKAGIIKLKDSADLTASIRDVEENKKNLKFIELEAAQIPKQLSEVDVAAINTNFALDAGINPKKDSILLESTDSPYVNYIVVRAENKDDPTIKKFVAAYQSDEVRKFIEEKFQGSVIPSW